MSSMNSDAPVVVLGGGPAGLGAAYWLARAGKPVLLLEKEPRVGGMGATIKMGPYAADYGPHTFHLKDSVVSDLFNSIVGDDCSRVCREARVWLRGRTLPFPLRVRDVATSLSPFLTTRIGMDYLWQRTVRSWTLPAGWKPASFEEWGRFQFGETLYRLAFGNYSEKMWGLPGARLSAKLARQKLTGLDLKQLILSALGLLPEDKARALGLSRKALYDAYPREGIGTFFEGMAREIERMGGRILLSTRPTSVEMEGSRASAVTFEREGATERIACEALVSSVPLPALSALMPPDRFAAARTAAGRIRYRSLCVVHLALAQESFSEAHWIYLLDERLVSNRLSEQKNLSPGACPPDQTVVCLDITCDFDDYLWQAQDSFLIGLAMNDLRVMGLHPRTIRDAFVLRAPHVYPIYTRGFENDVDEIVSLLRTTENVFSIGRHGLFLNNDMHDSIEMGFMASQMLLEHAAPPSWYDRASRYVQERLEGYVRDPIKFVPKS